MHLQTANFKLPEAGELFDDVEYVELDKEAAEKLVSQYNKEGQDANPAKGSSIASRIGGGSNSRRDNDRGSRGKPPLSLFGPLLCSGMEQLIDGFLILHNVLSRKYNTNSEFVTHETGQKCYNFLFIAELFYDCCW